MDHIDIQDGTRRDHQLSQTGGLARELIIVRDGEINFDLTTMTSLVV